jgi:pimeloyl-ACP methyl ester carboxylesterase
MPRTTLLLAATLLGSALGAVIPPAAGALAFASCASSAAFECTTVLVPLDRSGQLPGAIALSLERKPAAASGQSGAAPSQSAVVALAGGPGQAALPLGEFIAKAFVPALGGHDLLVFDQRGTGSSDPLACPALGGSEASGVSQLLEQCALQIGPARGAFTTPESVQDIEAIRQAGGYQKLVLYGTSYGTKVALAYAARYPQRVEALVLDSVVPPEGPEPLAVPTFQAIAPALGELCAGHACAGITPNPLSDLARLAGRLRGRALRGSVYDGRGHRHGATLDEQGLLDVLEAGDLNPALRALLPAAVRSALAHDPAPLLRLHLLSQGLIPTLPGHHRVESAEGIDEALFVTTSCEELSFPWRRAAAAPTRLAEANAYLGGLPGSDFYPFDASIALENSLIPDCAAWPDASPPPVPLGPLPSVPTLILSGAQDLRTPTAGAQRVAALIAGARLEVVPYTGHSVLGSDFSNCAERALAAFFAGAAVQPCGAVRDVFAPTPVTPTKLAYVHAPPGLGGRPGRTLTAVLDTIVDLDRQVISATLQANQALPSGSSFGGLHGGYARLSSSTVALHKLSFVAGVALSGTFPIRNGALGTVTVRVSGSAAAAGTVEIGLGRRVSGTLGGRRFDLSLAMVKLSRAGEASAEWPARGFPLPGLARLR